MFPLAALERAVKPGNSDKPAAGEAAFSALLDAYRDAVRDRWHVPNGTLPAARAAVERAFAEERARAERAEAEANRKAAQEWNDTINRLSERVKAAERERDEERARAERVVNAVNALLHEKAKAVEERDEARAERDRLAAEVERLTKVAKDWRASRDERADAALALTRDLDAARSALGDACDVAVWMSGARDFSPGGEAHERWLVERERLFRAIDVLKGAALARAADPASSNEEG